MKTAYEIFEEAGAAHAPIGIYSFMKKAEIEQNRKKKKEMDGARKALLIGGGLSAAGLAAAAAAKHFGDDTPSLTLDVANVATALPLSGAGLGALATVLKTRKEDAGLAEAMKEFGKGGKGGKGEAEVIPKAVQQFEKMRNALVGADLPVNDRVDKLTELFEPTYRAQQSRPHRAALLQEFRSLDREIKKHRAELDGMVNSSFANADSIDIGRKQSLITDLESRLSKNQAKLNGGAELARYIKNLASSGQLGEDEARRIQAGFGLFSGDAQGFKGLRNMLSSKTLNLRQKFNTVLTKSHRNVRVLGRWATLAAALEAGRYGVNKLVNAGIDAD